jgi:hypothetical protein
MDPDLTRIFCRLFVSGDSDDNNDESLKRTNPFSPRKETVANFLVNIALPLFSPGSNPTIMSYHASFVKFLEYHESSGAF